MEMSVASLVGAVMAALVGAMVSFLTTYSKYRRSINEDKITYEKNMSDLCTAQAGRDLNALQRVSDDFHRTTNQIMEFAREQNANFMRLLEEKNKYFSERLDAISKSFDVELRFLAENFKEMLTRNNNEYLSVLASRLDSVDEVNRKIEAIAFFVGMRNSSTSVTPKDSAQT